LHKYRHKIMKKFLLTTTAVLTILFSQAQIMPCDSLTISGSQYQLTIDANNLNTFVDYWVTTAGSTTLAEDSMTNSHPIYNYNNNTGLPYDTLTTCITVNFTGITCCVIWIWNGSFWAKMGATTPIGEINSPNREVLKVVDMLGRNANGNKNEPLFYIYNDGTVEKKIILE